MAASAAARERARQDGTASAVWHGLRHDKLHYARRMTDAVLAGFAQNNLLTYASAIGFRLLFAIIPFVLFVLGVAGAFRLEGVWERHLAGDLATQLSPAAFRVVNDTVEHILRHQHVFWATLGAALAIWEVSGAVRAVMGAFSRIYGARSERGFWVRMAISIALAIAVGILFVLALGVVQLSPLVLGSHGGAVAVVLFLARWAVALVLLVLAVGLLVRVAPGTPQPLPWVSFGALLTVVAWLVMSLLFDAYLTWVAVYDSIYGNLATVVILMEYVYFSAIVFVGGIQADALVREQFIGDAAGEVGGGRLTRGPSHSGS